MLKNAIFEPRVSVDRQRTSWWVVVVVVCCAILLAAGAAIAAVRPALLGTAADPVTATERVFADYVVARNGALALLLVLLLGVRAVHGLVIALLLVALIQIGDAILDSAQGRLDILPVAAAIAIACIAAAVRHSPKPLWQLSTWRSM
jgi:hypothetical protein